MIKKIIFLSRKFLIKPARGLCKKVILLKKRNKNVLANNDGVKVEMESGPFPEWTEFTRECLLDIFSRLSMEQRWTGPMLVCKTWMNACTDPSLNSVFDLETSFLYSSSPVNRWSPQFGRKVNTILRSVVDRSEGGLTEIRVRHCTDISISYVAERCPNLEVLWVKYCSKVTSESMKTIALNCPKLKELDISCSYEISCECLMIIGSQCKNLQILKRNMVDPLEVARLKLETIVPYTFFESLRTTYGNIDARATGNHMHHLKHLELQFSTLTDKGLAYLCKKSPGLEYLDLFGCTNLTSHGITNSTLSLKYLKEIKKPNFLLL